MFVVPGTLGASAISIANALTGMQTTFRFETVLASAAPQGARVIFALPHDPSSAAVTINPDFSLSSLVPVVELGAGGGALGPCSVTVVAERFYDKTLKSFQAYESLLVSCPVANAGGFPAKTRVRFALSDVLVQSKAAPAHAQPDVMVLAPDGARVIDATTACAFPVVAAFDCGRLPAALSYAVSYVDKGNGETAFASTALVNCLTGFALEGGSSQDAFRVCTAQGWTALTVRCAPVSCGPLPAPANGAVLLRDRGNGDTFFDATATFSCAGGYFYSSLPVRTCQAAIDVATGRRAGGRAGRRANVRVCE